MLFFSQFKLCFLAHLALKSTFRLPWTQGHTKKIISQDKNTHLQTVRARLNHLTCISSLSCQHKMQQQACPFCQYNPVLFILFIQPTTHLQPLSRLLTEGLTFTQTLTILSFNIMVGHTQKLRADHFVFTECGPSLGFTFMTAAN